MKGLREYLLFLCWLTVTMVLGVICLSVFFYLISCFIMWEWLTLPINDLLETSGESFRIGIVAYLITSLMVYSWFKN